MSTKKAKTENAVIADQKEKTVIDLTEILKNVANITVKDKGNNLSRASLYKYSEEELLSIKADKDEGKKIRNKARKRLDYFMFAIVGKAQRSENYLEVVEDFKTFYTERFLRNDFSLSSLREEKSLDEKSKLIFSTALEIVKTTLAK